MERLDVILFLCHRFLLLITVLQSELILGAEGFFLVYSNQLFHFPNDLAFP